MKHKSVYVSFGACLLGLVVLRTLQLLFTIETATGFYKPTYEYFAYVLIAAVLFSVAVIIYFSVVDLGRVNQNPNLKVKSVASIVVGGLFAAKCVESIDYYKNSKLGMFVLVVEILAAAGFILFGALNIANKKPNPAISLMFIPVFIVELIVVFVKNNGVNSVPERVYDVVMLALCVWFSIQLAKHINGHLSEKETKIMFVEGLFTSAACIITILPRNLVAIFGYESLLHKSAISEPIYFVFGIFVLIYVVDLFWVSKNKN